MNKAVSTTEEKENKLTFNYKGLLIQMVEKELSKGELLKQAGVNSGFFQRVNRHQPVSLVSLAKICKTLGCTLDEVVVIE